MGPFQAPGVGVGKHLEVTQDQAQAALDRLCVRLDGRKRVCDGITTTVGRSPTRKDYARYRRNTQRCWKCDAG